MAIRSYLMVFETDKDIADAFEGAVLGKDEVFLDELSSSMRKRFNFDPFCVAFQEEDNLRRGFFCRTPKYFLIDIGSKSFDPRTYYVED